MTTTDVQVCIAIKRRRRREKREKLNIQPVKKTGAMLAEHGAAVFSVFDARARDWQERRRYWRHRGVDSSRGGANLRGFGEKVLAVSSPGFSGTGVFFDPVLAERFFGWYVPAGGEVLDPFAGGPTRGIVASMLGYQYLGIDIRPKQIEKNRRKAWKLCQRNVPRWIAGDSLAVLPTIEAESVDAVFSSPPYFDIMHYSDDPRDLSTMSWENFLAAYREIVRLSAQALKPDRFAAFLVGEVRDREGHLRAFVPETIRAFADAGLRFHDDVPFIVAPGSLFMRAPRPFRTSRILGRTHQWVAIFVKGDARKATAAIEAARAKSRIYVA